MRLRSLAVLVFLPAAAMIVGAGAVVRAGAAPLPGEARPTIALVENGHFWTQADVNGAPVRFLIDTGASMVALTLEDARRVGLDIDMLAYDTRVNTAAGAIDAARVTLSEIVLGEVRQSNIHALIVRDGLTDSLLGMNFLQRLSRFEATPEGLLLDG